MSADQAIGMMDAAYFTGRKEILEWINRTLALGITKIETTCTGAVACQLIDAHFPSKGNTAYSSVFDLFVAKCQFATCHLPAVPMSKVNWEAKSDYEYVNNYKVLQSAFNKLNIEKKADVEKLCRGKYQDNLEFMQWFKGFLDRHSVVEGYDPIAARSKGKGAGRVEQFFGKPGVQLTTVKPRKHNYSHAATSDKHRGAPPPPPEKENHYPIQGIPRSSKIATSLNDVADITDTGASAFLALEKRITTLESSNNELTLNVEGLEKERDFYFDKLREIEVLLQSREDSNPLIDSIFQILYHTTDEFVALEEGSET